MITSPLSSKQLKEFVKQLEELDNENKRILETITELLSCAKNMGYDPAILKEVTEIYKVKKETTFQEEELFDLYKNIAKWADENHHPNGSK